MRIILLTAWIVVNLWQNESWATTRYVDAVTTGCSSPSDNDYSPVTDTCGSGTELVYVDIASAMSAASGSDRIIINAGTYTGTNNRLDTNNIPSGVQGNPTIIEGDLSSLSNCSKISFCPTTIQNNGTYGIWLNGISYVTIRNLKISGASTGSYPIIIGSNTGVASTGVLIQNVEATEASGATCLMNTATASFTIIEYNHLHGCGATRSSLGAYLQGDDVTFRNNWVHDNSYYGVQCYSSSTVSDMRPDRCKVHYNVIENNRNASGELGLAMGGYDTEVIGNIIKGAFSSGFDGGSQNMIVANNVFPSNGIGIAGSGSNNSGIVVQNNVVWGSISVGSSASGTITNSYNACRSGDSCGSNKLTIAALTDIFVSSSDFSLKQASPAINAGTAASVSASRNCNGACDIGAYEAFNFSSASISGNTIDIVLSGMIFAPVVPSLSGWSITCTGSGCGVPSILSVSRKTDTSTTVSLSITGLSGGNCAVGQTWTVSYSSASGGTVDSHPLITQQELTDFSGQSVTNGCAATGIALPGTPYIIYEFDDNLNDTSGNNLHATGNGISFADAKYWRGMKTDAGQDDYAEMPYFSGVDPSSQSLTISGGIYIDPTDVASTRGVGGAGTGSNQRFHIYYSGGTWRLAVQANGGATPTEFSVQSGWNHVCVTFDSAIDTATLWVNGTAGVSSGSSLQTYTSFAFPGNFRIGRFVGSSLASGPNHIYDRWVVWRAKVDCQQAYQNWEPPISTWSGTLSIVSTRIFGAKLDAVASTIPLAALNTDVTIPAGAAFTYASQMDCSVSDCTAIGRKLYYSCDTCTSGGTELLVPDSATADGIEFWGSISEPGLLSGPHGANLSGALTHVNGSTNAIASTVPIVDLNTSNSTVMRYILRIAPGTPTGRTFHFREHEQSGALLNSYTPSNGIGVTVGVPSASVGP